MCKIKHKITLRFCDDEHDDGDENAIVDRYLKFENKMSN